VASHIIATVALLSNSFHILKTQLLFIRSSFPEILWSGSHEKCGGIIGARFTGLYALPVTQPLNQPCQNIKDTQSTDANHEKSAIGFRLFLTDQRTPGGDRTTPFMSMIRRRYPARPRSITTIHVIPVNVTCHKIARNGRAEFLTSTDSTRQLVVVWIGFFT